MADTLSIAILVILTVFVIIITVVCCCVKNNASFSSPSCPCKRNNSLPSSNSPSNSTSSTPKETFLVSPNGAQMAETGAIHGLGLQTNQMTRSSMESIVNRVNSNGWVADGTIHPGVGLGNGFQTAYDNQQNIIDIGNKAMGGFETNDQLKQITQQITATNNNANNNLFTRAGDKPTKLYLAPNEVRCIIDEKYMSERDKNRQISSVGTVIPTQGYDVNVERLGEQLLDTHFSAISLHCNKSRIPTAAGASNTKGNDSPNMEAIKQIVDVTGNDVTIKDVPINGDSTNIKTALDEGAGVVSENFKRRYV